MDKRAKTFILMSYDVVATVGAWVLSMVLLRYDVTECVNEVWYFMVIAALLTVGVHLSTRLYFVLWRYASTYSAMRIVISTAIFGVYNVVVAALAKTLAVEWAVLSAGMLFVAVSVSRFAPRVLSSAEVYVKRRDLQKKRAMIVGAGAATSMLLKELRVSENADINPVCILDDNVEKLNKELYGVRIVGTISDAVDVAEKYGVEEIIISIPSADKKTISRIIEECNKTKCKVKIVPSIYQLASGKVSVTEIKDVSIDDLLGREQVNVNLDEIMGYIEGQTVLVTGGGGSIGSELCRQIAEHNPKELIILDIYENNAYDIQQELLRKLPNLSLTVLIASVRDKVKIEDVFKKYKPDVVFHAAAHKHVPLMETSPNEAVKNNVGGTYNVAQAAGKFGAKRFVLISTDKAVNPTNVMGATKRICEMIVQSMNKKYQTEYVAVRFGNVLGSNGSVIPLFKKQIKEGGPVTVTHKDIVRYFMTIPEAVSLVLQAGAYAEGGEIFVLDMGDPVRIYDLAVNMIRLSGFEPFKDIDVKVTGLRPGEKLYEERLMEEEGLKKTENEKISIGKPLDIDEKKLFSRIELLVKQAEEETESMKDLVSELVPTYVIDRKH